MHSSRIIIPLNCAVWASLLWLAAVSLVVADVYVDWRGDGTLARLSILVAIAAGALTVGAMINHAKGVVLDVISWEHQQTRRALQDDTNSRLSTPIMRKQGG